MILIQKMAVNGLQGKKIDLLEAILAADGIIFTYRLDYHPGLTGGSGGEG